MKGHGSKLPLKLEQAILALLETGSIEATAKALSIGVSTLQRWMRRDDFRAAYGKARREVFEFGLSRLHALTSQAVRCLEKNLTCGRPMAEIRAAGVILEHARHGAELMDVLDRLTALEQKVTG